MPVDVSVKARVIAGLVVGSLLALIFLAVGCRGEYGVIEEERVYFTPAETAAIKWDAHHHTSEMQLRRTVILENDTLSEAEYAAAFARMYR